MTKEQQPQEPVEEAAEQVEQPEADAVEAVEGDIQSPEQQRIEELEKALAAAENKLEEQKDSVLRAIANAENTSRRAEGEIDKARKFALERFANELLPVADNLERAMQAGDTSNEAVKPLLDGVELTFKSFISTIEKFGVKLIDPTGESFNPELHQAMSMQESAEHPANTVLAVMQKGYELNGRLLRPAMVVVSRAATDGVDTEA
ncbi:nucleotide exchange factor GrpE [Neptunicella marina]|uniref:Protein GrpE n=1 Tax=Neptunicella marina TaxID=2125989 RepID=A0A8J6M369_9ALTE|nr:nucleotide exchange factor GrpE [Neptunicella marina]MBC3767198.1 nucleotide exchange factor GrpE [Neptunicella marina]